MLITERVPRHVYSKELDYYEMLFRTRLMDIENHMVNVSNPHQVTSDQVHITSTDPLTVWHHITNSGIHHYYGPLSSVVFTGAQILAWGGKALFDTLKGSVYEYVYVDGILKARDIPGGADYDYSVVHNSNYPPGPCTTEIWFNDAADVIEADSVVQILYCETL
ncbi:MAG: hypothetical protein A2Y38_04285 [Spirochaetes bacterium GWB1_59_5]|nr:MAG: hypothetical protein A2Y38_04285 [Spirochaetes bacterium GWB1_59_5]